MSRPWSDVDCPYKVLQVFMTVSAGEEQVHQEQRQQQRTQQESLEKKGGREAAP